MLKCDFNKVAKLQIALRHECSPVNLLHIFRTTFSRNTCGWLLLDDLDQQSKVHSSFTHLFIFLEPFHIASYKLFINSFEFYLH